MPSLCRSIPFCRHGLLCLLSVCDILGWLPDSWGQGLGEERAFSDTERQPALHHRLRTTIVTLPSFSSLLSFLCTSTSPFPSSALTCLPSSSLLPILLFLPPPFLVLENEEQCQQRQRVIAVCSDLSSRSPEVSGGFNMIVGPLDYNKVQIFPSPGDFDLS